jgi:DUF4097 and DUF4098 domain-containing protein YvlB
LNHPRWTYLIAIVAVLVATGPARSQSRDSELIDQLRIELDGLSRDMAEEYLDVLDNLQDVLDDYTAYMEEQSDEAQEHRIDGVEVLQRRLKHGDYTDDPEKLLDDIYETIDEIKALESAHRAKFNTNSPKCCRLGRSLRKELIITAELIEDYTDQHSLELLQGGEMQKYLAEAIKSLAKLKEAKKLADLDTEEVRAALKALEALGLDGRVLVWPDALVTPEPRKPVKPPEPPEPPEPPKVVWPDYGRGRRTADRAGAQHTSQGQVQVTNSSWPILIENPSGDIYVTGTAGKMLSATLTLEVASTTHAKEKEYLDRTLLAVGREGSGYYARVDLPRLSDTRTELLNSVLLVTVPGGNPIECSNSFGQVEIADIQARVSVDGNNSSIKLQRIHANAAVQNSMGPISAEDIEGNLEFETSYAPITIIRCQGGMLLENQYSQIALENCQGKVEINNTGQIDIKDHIGDLSIDNAYGVIDIDDVEGNIFVKNLYQPLNITRLRGSAELENHYAEIKVDEIGGRLTISNTNGPIFGEDLSGPLELSNYYGNVSLVLGRSFKGGSTITNTQGTVKVAFVDQPNIVLSMYTVGGTISSSLPLRVKTQGDAKSAELVLGNGGETLEISGAGSAIIIQGR